MCVEVCSSRTQAGSRLCKEGLGVCLGPSFLHYRKPEALFTFGIAICPEWTPPRHIEDAFWDPRPGPHWRTAYSADVLCETRDRRTRRTRRNSSRMDHTPSDLQVLHCDANDMFVNPTVLAAGVCEHTVCFHWYKHLHSVHESRYFIDGKHVKFYKRSKQ